jgi:hypothetical protein
MPEIGTPPGLCVSRVLATVQQAAGASRGSGLVNPSGDTRPES